tara:strand:+ start:757 stop:999 length:243 start_codon:yes stop_codon:yes gene_type:complete
LSFFTKEKIKRDLEKLKIKIQFLDKFNSRKLIFENMRFFLSAIKIFYSGELQKILPTVCSFYNLKRKITLPFLYPQLKTI